MKMFAGIVIISALAGAAPNCEHEFQIFGLSDNFNETVAHAIHSITLNILREFEPTAKAENGVPVVNPRLNDPTERDRVVAHAPEEKIERDFYGDAMNTIDVILSQIGGATDGFGPHWSPLERIVHQFHMKDLWKKLKPTYSFVKKMVDGSAVADLCMCLKDTKSNGIYVALEWIARRYGSEFTLDLSEQHQPVFRGSQDWKVWKEHLLTYYTLNSLYDAALYLYCALNH